MHLDAFCACELSCVIEVAFAVLLEVEFVIERLLFEEDSCSDEVIEYFLVDDVYCGEFCIEDFCEAYGVLGSGDARFGTVEVDHDMSDSGLGHINSLCAFSRCGPLRA